MQKASSVQVGRLSRAAVAPHRVVDPACTARLHQLLGRGADDVVKGDSRPAPLVTHEQQPFGESTVDHTLQLPVNRERAESGMEGAQ